MPENLPREQNGITQIANELKKTSLKDVTHKK